MIVYLLIALAVALVTFLLMYLDSRLFDRPKKRLTYVKTISMTVLIVLGTVYVLTWLSPSKSVKDVVQIGGQTGKINAGPTIKIPQIAEEMLTGDAPF
jgi:hypothetical protein